MPQSVSRWETPVALPNKVASLSSTLTLDVPYTLELMKIDFVISGTQKGGTSALDAYLREHPEICMADKKEVHYFDNEDFYCYEQLGYLNYHSFFSPNESHKILGEATPIYMYWYDAPKHIWQYNSNMKLIAILRNPIERAYSHWNMERSRGADKLSFWDALISE